MTLEHSTPGWVAGVFAAIDAKDAAAFASYLTADAVFRFGNMPGVQGREAIEAAVGGFFQSIAALRHELAEVWTGPGVVVSHGTVCYTRHDGSQLTVPFADIFRCEGEKVRDYLIFIDTSQLYAAS